MKRRLLLGATALSLLAVLGAGLAGAAPGSYTVTCAAGGQTSVSWRHAKLDQVAFTWADSAGTAYPGTTVPLTFKPPHGYVITQTPRSAAGLGPTSVTLLLGHTDGSGTDQVQAACT
jgi:hypothetical protein